MSSSGAEQLIHRSRRCLRVALRHWKATDLKRINECRRLLKEAVSSLEAAIHLLQHAATVPDGLPAVIAGLRCDISIMIRLVDACGAFHRGITLAGRGAGPSYDRSGQTMGGRGAVTPMCVLG